MTGQDAPFPPPERLRDDCFAAPPGAHWTPVDAALDRLQAALRPVVGVETVALEAALGRVVAEDAAALRAHPAADNSAVDGYAFRHPGDAAPQATFRLVEGRAAAGAPWRGRLQPGEALRIFTGAPMPEGADTVCLQEDAVTTGDCAVALRLPAKRGANRRLAGENLGVGATALAQGARVTPQALAQAASAGLATLAVRARLGVAVLSTGDELIEPAEAAAAGPSAVVDANGPMLAALTERLGARVAWRGRAPDQAAAVAAALDAAADAADVIIASGGASGGDEDHMSRLLAERAAGGFHLWRIAMKPGRPLALGLWRGKPVFGLPGNPVAAFVCFLLFVRPALLRLGGAPWTTPRRLTLVSGFDFPKKPGRREFLRVRVGEDGRLERYRSEGSGLIEGLLWADGLADLGHDAGPVRAGDPVAYLPFAALGASD